MTVNDKERDLAMDGDELVVETNPRMKIFWDRLVDFKLVKYKGKIKAKCVHCGGRFNEQWFDDICHLFRHRFQCGRNRESEMETTFSAINKALSILNDSSSLSCVKVQISFESWMGDHDNDLSECFLELRKFFDDDAKSRGDAKPSECRINSLPESILFHVLSFLTFKEAVKCSVLSKKWRHLYTAIPVIDFGHVNFLIPFRVVTQQGFGHGEHQLQKPDFFAMVDRFLLSHDSYLRGFKLKVTLTNETEKNHLETLLHRVVDVKKVEELSLTVETPDQFYCLPLHLFNCTSVLHLMLGNCNFESRTDGMVMFPVLKSLILHISTPAFDGGHLYRMLGECPQLKSLTIQGCRNLRCTGSGTSREHVALQQLREVNVKSFTGNEAESMFLNYVLTCGPSIERLHIRFGIYSSREMCRALSELLSIQRQFPLLKMKFSRRGR